MVNTPSTLLVDEFSVLQTLEVSPILHPPCSISTLSRNAVVEKLDRILAGPYGYEQEAHCSVQLGHIIWNLVSVTI